MGKSASLTMCGWHEGVKAHFSRAIGLFYQFCVAQIPSSSFYKVRNRISPPPWMYIVSGVSCDFDTVPIWRFLNATFYSEIKVISRRVKTFHWILCNRWKTSKCHQDFIWGLCAVQGLSSLMWPDCLTRLESVCELVVWSFVASSEFGALMCETGSF